MTAEESKKEISGNKDPLQAARKAKSVAIALLFHLALVVLAGLVVIATKAPIEPEIVAKIVAPDKIDPPKMEKKTVMKQVKQASASASASPIARMIRSNTVAVIAVPEVTKVSDGPVGLGQGDFGDGFGNGGGSGGGMGSGASFFGMKTSKDLVIVIDISGSMVQGSNSRKSYDELEKEAIRAISSLNSSSRFNIIAFAGESFTFQSGMAMATSSNRGNALEWIKSYSPCLVLPKGAEKGNGALWNTPDGKRHRGTSSGKALRAAFEMKPGTIIFVSDGEPTDKSAGAILKDVADLQSSQSKKVTIHAIAYRAGGGQEFMESLAKKNAGDFQDMK